MGSSICGNKDRSLVVGTIALKNTAEDTKDFSDLLFKQEDKNIEELTVLELLVKCTNLFAENRFQLLSPVAYVSIEENNEFVKKIETEVLSSTVNPIFRKPIRVAYSMDKDFQIKFEIFDMQNKKSNKVLIGSNIFTLHELASRNEAVTKDLIVQGKRNGMISVKAKEQKHSVSTLTMQWEFSSSNFTKGYVFLRISRSYGEIMIPVYQSETKNEPYNWEKFDISVNRFCRGIESKILMAEVVSFDSGNTVIGSARFTLSLLHNNPKFKIETYLGEVPTGILTLAFFSCSVKNTFLDFIHSGIEIAPIYAIDFSEPTGHKDIDLDENPYLNSIKELQNILQYYYIDPLYPVLGTGAIFQSIDKPSDYFALTGNIFQPEIPTHTMLQDYYKTTLNSISHSKITKYNDIIESTIKYVKHELKDNQKYYTLIIISAGDPIDSENIIKKYSTISELPLSILNIKVSNDLIIYENLEKLKFTSNPRGFFDSFDSKNIGLALEKIREHMMSYAKYKSLNILEKSERISTNRSNSLKVTPDKIRLRSSYYTKCKAEYIEFLRKVGHSREKIEEVAAIGVPFLLMEDNQHLSLPTRYRSKSIRQRSIRNSAATCLNCSKLVFKLEESLCGCKYFCFECVDKNSCPECTKRKKI
ncbi:hypothetical protein SteCoe_12722 [Stentor coeruleus]|uniref:C2 domain-containing protein n=1 Tax=Stentor coeruleus TaxID=5963 RepID=A0A1R2CA89_9CILI|nr:hypothetical protein SteCoe_12722 [Stentor coeruleus]